MVSRILICALLWGLGQLPAQESKDFSDFLQELTRYRRSCGNHFNRYQALKGAARCQNSLAY